MDQNYINPQAEKIVSIDWPKYISAFLQNWKKIGIITFIFAAAGVCVALTQARKYSVSVTLAPESAGGHQTGNIGGLASMLGVNVGGGSSSSDALNITIFPEIVSSTPFLTSLFNVELNKMPKLPKDLAEARAVMSGPLTSVKLFDYLTGRDAEPSWWDDLKQSVWGVDKAEEDADYLVVDERRLTKEQYYTMLVLKNMISVEVDKATAMTTVSVVMDDPLMCAQLADTVCRRLRDFVFDYRTEKERQTLAYYEAMCDSTYRTMVDAQAAYAASIDNNHNVILQKVSVQTQRLEQEASVASQVYQQMVQQREMSRANLQQVKPVFAVVEPATLPQLPVNSRKNTVIMFVVLGFVLSFSWYVIVEEYYNLYVGKLEKIIEMHKTI